MLFTEGELSSFERMMTEIPRPPGIKRTFESNQLRGPTIQERNCPDCLFYDSRRKQAIRTNASSLIPSLIAGTSTPRGQSVYLSGMDNAAFPFPQTPNPSYQLKYQPEKRN